MPVRLSFQYEMKTRPYLHKPCCMMVWSLFWNEIIETKSNMKQAVIPRLLDTGMCFCSGMKKQLGWTRTGMNRSGMIYCAGIM